MDSVQPTWFNDSLKNVFFAIARRIRSKSPNQAVDLRDLDKVWCVKLLGQGGYNSVWLVQTDELLQVDADGSLADKFVLRLPHDRGALHPNQITNEVAFRRLVRIKLPHIPVPEVYFYQATDCPNTSFIVEEFIDGKPLDQEWMSLSSSQKETMARTLVNTIVDLAEVRFDKIGGLNPEDLSLAPTVEGCKVFKGREKFHRKDCYHIGPYESIKEYILACYDREIYYYTHATRDDLDTSFFTETSVEEFVAQLCKKQAILATTDIAEEPFALDHGDFHGRNILVRDGQLVALLDWEFAGSYPLSEILTGGGIGIVDLDNEVLDFETLVEEDTLWNDKIRTLIPQELSRRGWDQNWIDLLMGDGNRELALARCEMFPWNT